jgi:hypothetical protein
MTKANMTLYENSAELRIYIIHRSIELHATQTPLFLMVGAEQIQILMANNIDFT